MTDTTTNLPDQRLADNVRAAADALAVAWNVAADAGLTVDVRLEEQRFIGRMSQVIPLVSVKRSQDL